ncbi:MAG: hypothetical protein ABIP79_11885 [Chitinophagaceae bacterium]
MHNYPEENDYNFKIDLACNISRISNNSLSLSVSDDSYTGGPRPNTSITTLNFLFNPERLASLDDIIDYSSYPEFAKNMIERYGSVEQKDFLKDHLDIPYYPNSFLLTEESIELVLLEGLPRYMMTLAFLEIPIKDLKLKVEI